MKDCDGKQAMLRTLEAILASSPKNLYLYPHSTARTMSMCFRLIATNCCSRGVYLTLVFDPRFLPPSAARWASRGAVDPKTASSIQRSGRAKSSGALANGSSTIRCCCGRATPVVATAVADSAAAAPSYSGAGAAAVPAEGLAGSGRRRFDSASDGSTLARLRSARGGALVLALAFFVAGGELAAGLLQAGSVPSSSSLLTMILRRPAPASFPLVRRCAEAEVSGVAVVSAGASKPSISARGWARASSSISLGPVSPSELITAGPAGWGTVAALAPLFEAPPVLAFWGCVAFPAGAFVKNREIESCFAGGIVPCPRQPTVTKQTNDR
eukprot:m.63578 g.63578  ORF g.63578 m.63578 type:complete len:327 (+) comp9664_c1_seq1:4642-5622(+)